MSPTTPVREWMSTDLVTISPETPVRQAQEIMAEQGIRRLPVMDGEKLVGIVTLGDLRGALPSQATSLSVWEVNTLVDRLTVDQIMSHPVITIPLDATIERAAHTMLEHKIAGLPVMEGSKLVGIITDSDVFRMIVRSWRPEPEKVPAA